MHAEAQSSTSPRKTPNLSTLPKADDELMAAFGPERRFTRQQYLFRAGEACACIYLVVHGSVKVSTLSANGDEQIVRFHLPGELLGLEALGEQNHHSSAMALEATRVRPLSLPALHALSARSPHLYGRLLRIVSRHITELQEHMLMLGRKSASERLAGFLNDLTDRTQTRDLTLSMSRDAIGSYLGITLETVSRLLHRFEKEQLIALDGRRVRLMQPAKLREIAEGAYACAA